MIIVCANFALSRKRGAQFAFQFVRVYQFFHVVRLLYLIPGYLCTEYKRELLQKFAKSVTALFLRRKHRGRRIRVSRRRPWCCDPEGKQRGVYPARMASTGAV